jgi:uncharacterized protein (TIGR04222 family)
VPFLTSPAPTSSILFIYPALCFVAVGFSMAVSWMFRELKAKVPTDLTIYDQAFLVGGPVRAIEMALFHLIRDGWVYSDGKGYVYPRFTEASGLSPLENELLAKAVETKSIDGRLLSRVILPGLEPIEQRLLRRGLILTEKEFSLGRLLTRVPLGLVFAYGLRWIYLHTMKADESPWLVAISALTFFFFIHGERGNGRLTHLGDSVVDQLRAERDARVKEKDSHDAIAHERASYDRLWQIKDEILFTGFTKMHGTAFSTSTRGDGDQPQTMDGVPGSAHSGSSGEAYPTETQDEAVDLVSDYQPELASKADAGSGEEKTAARDVDDFGDGSGQGSGTKT